jgi:hypothetical protein
VGSGVVEGAQMIKTDIVKVKRENQMCFKIYHNLEQQVHWNILYLVKAQTKNRLFAQKNLLGRIVDREIKRRSND